MHRLVCVLSLVGCGEPWLEMEPGRVCDDVGYAIAARTFECTDDEALSGERHAAFLEGYGCRVRSLEEPIDRYYHCPIAVNAVSCASVRKWGDDLDAWLAESPVCAVILEYADGEPLPGLEEP